jgi:hypothetical protein
MSDTSSSQEAKITTLLDLLPRWAKEPGSKKCLLQLFVSFLDLNKNQAVSEITRCYDKFNLRSPTFLRVMELYELKIIATVNGFAKPRNGVLQWLNKIEEAKIPPGVYALLGAPFDSNESEARTALNAFSAMVATLYGFATLHSKACEFILDIQTGSYSVTSPVIENPSFYAIDHAKEIPLEEISSLAARINEAPIGMSELLVVAFTYMNRAIREENHGIRLSLYFSVIEVLTGETSTNSVCKMLKMSHQELRAMGYDDLLGRRNAFVHKGKSAHLHRGEERLLQYLIVDCISNKLQGRETHYARQYLTALAEQRASGMLP